MMDFFFKSHMTAGPLHKFQAEASTGEGQDTFVVIKAV